MEPAASAGQRSPLLQTPASTASPNAWFTCWPRVAMSSLAAARSLSSLRTSTLMGGALATSCGGRRGAERLRRSEGRKGLSALCRCAGCQRKARQSHHALQGPGAGLALMAAARAQRAPLHLLLLRHLHLQFSTPGRAAGVSNPSLCPGAAKGQQVGSFTQAGPAAAAPPPPPPPAHLDGHCLADVASPVGAARGGVSLLGGLGRQLLLERAAGRVARRGEGAELRRVQSRLRSKNCGVAARELC